MRRSLLVATHNAHKTHEIRAMLGDEFAVSDLTARAEMAVPEETGATFEENAVIKALAACRWIRGIVLADDSGLEVDALDGAPGVRSARFAGADADDAANRRALLEALARAKNLDGQKLCARFRCVMALAFEGNVLATFAGTVEGAVITAERGSNGFGYDSLFVPDGYEATFAEMPAEMKNALSHRARALEKVRSFLRKTEPSGGEH